MAPNAPPDAEPVAPAFRRRDAVIACLCVLAGLGFGILVGEHRGSEQAQQYYAGYLIELALSVDNVFVFALIFERVAVSEAARRRLLFLGIVGAVFLRLTFIFAGIGAIERFAWLVPVLGAFILITAVRLAAGRRGGFDPSDHPVVRFVAARIPAALATLVVLETVDLVFALDSLPAVIAVTHDKLIALSSNFFAVAGLRSLFFVVSGALKSLRFLKPGLVAVLAFVGIKMLADPWYRIPTGASLAVIASLLGLSIGASLLVSARRRR